MLVRLLLLLLALVTPLPGAPLKLQLPTDNDALYRGKPEEFYMHVNRWRDGKNLKPWSGGQFGYVRNLRKLSDSRVIATRFHEGIDIRPIHRDAAGRSKDQIRPIATGVVTYVNSNAALSNYGKYLVVQHDWGDGPLYSLYAHLSEISVKIGQKVGLQTVLGVMGDTGSGLNRERSHLHLELCLLLSDHFDTWHQKTRRGQKNPHGLYHGHNLVGLDIASLLLAQHQSDTVTLPTFLKAAQPYYRVTVPRQGPLQIVTRYPWLRLGDHDQPSPSWEITFTDSGVPLSVQPSNRVVQEPTITDIRPTESRHEFFTSGRVTGTGNQATLSPRGRTYLSLITYQPPAPRQN